MGKGCLYANVRYFKSHRDIPAAKVPLRMRIACSEHQSQAKEFTEHLAVKISKDSIHQVRGESIRNPGACSLKWSAQNLLCGHSPWALLEQKYLIADWCHTVRDWIEWLRGEG